MPIDSKIRDIIKRDGHIKIDDMMRNVLSLNNDSYYKSVKTIGKDGDFLTSPEISQLFGEMIALWAIRQWENFYRPKDFILLELGAGQGKLLQDFLRVAKVEPEFFAGLNLYILEINPHFIKKQEKNLACYNKNINWITNLDQLPKKPIIFLANEFFDALPVKQYMKAKDKWFESVLVIDPADGRIKYDKIELHQTLQKQLLLDHSEAKDGAIIEESIESLDIIRFLSKFLCELSGAGLIIDYGYNIKTTLRTRNQYNTTLQAIKNHQYHSIIGSLGEADLTAHVDFHSLQKAANERGILEERCKISSQREFLMDYGIGLRHKLLRESAPYEEKQIIDNQLFRLTSTDQMGELFKVLEISHELTKVLVEV